MALRKVFARDGYLLIKNLFTESEAKFLQLEASNLQSLPEKKGGYMKFYENPQPTDVMSHGDIKSNTGSNRILSRMENFLGERTELRYLVNNRVKTTLKEVTGNEMILFKDKINWKLPGGGAFKPHQDFEAWSDFDLTNFVTCALFADNSTTKNGCLEFVSGVHNDGILANDHGCLDPEIVESLNWQKIETSPRDMLLFDSYTPHKSEANRSKHQRRIYYFTFNLEKEGDYYEDYFNKKRDIFPPDFERDEELSQETLNSKYNLANPIS
jgi:ectoine hydroxylase-related dioxygenase (phytanoyl-CoA dioxygenase family)